MKLAHQLTLALTLSIGCTLCAAGAWLVHRESAAIHRDLEEDLLVMGRSLRSSFVHTWQHEGEDTAIDLFDKEGRRAERFDQVTVDWLPLAAVTDPAAQAELEHDHTWLKHSDDDGGVLKLWVPVQAEGVPRGALLLQRTLKDQRRFLAQSVTQVLAIVLALAAVLSGVVLLSGRLLVTAPLERLEALAHRLSSGELTARAELKRPADLARVASALNEMAASLQAAQEKTAAAHAAQLATLEQLRHSDRLATVGKLGAGIAHELGTPLTVIIGRAKMIANEVKDRPGAAENARIVADQARRLVELVRQLLDFSRREPGVKSPKDLCALAKESARLLEPMAAKKSLTVALELDEPSLSAPVVETQIRQALENLLLNGVHASKAMGTLTVEVHREHTTPPKEVGAPEGDYVRLSVQDQGCGITPEVLPKIFDPFFTTKPEGEGTGLGLSVAYGIARDHGGWIDVKTEPGKGSRFSIHLPTA
ncbi:MAG: ATP-binding protein [Myxococcaceae bacterium]